LVRSSLFWSIDLVWFVLSVAVYFLQKRNEKKEASEKKYYESRKFVNGELLMS
jgi:hypothetical protein